MSDLSANSIRVGNIIEHEDSSCRVMSISHVKPGKGGAFVQLSLKDVISNIKKNVRLRSSEHVKKVNLYKKKAKFLYIEKDFAIFIDNESYEMINVQLDLLEKKDIDLLVEDMEVEIESLDDSDSNKIIGISLPERIIVKILSSDTKPANQGSNSYKNAKIQNNVKIQVPSFINNDELVVIRSEDLSYIERANK